MFVVLHRKRPLSAADAFLVGNLGVGHEQYGPAPLTKSHAPIEVFNVQEIGLIHRTDGGSRGPSHHHAGARNRLDLDRVLWQRWRSRGAESLCEDDAWRRKLAPANRLLGTVRVKEKRPDHADAIFGLQCGNEAFDGAIGYSAIGIEQKHAFGRRMGEADVTAGGKAK